jgi:hypothetical protein
MKYVIFLLLISIVPRADAGARIPRLAELAGVRAGFDTVEGMEQKFGPGKPMAGGHPHGARSWQSKQTGCYLWADGFYYDNYNRRVIDSISISSPPKDDRLTPSKDRDPQIDLPSSSVRFMGSVTLGMSRAEVLRSLSGKLHSPQRNYKISNWTATLHFEQDRLDRICIEVDAGYAD